MLTGKYLVWDGDEGWLVADYSLTNGFREYVVDIETGNFVGYRPLHSVTHYIKLEEDFGSKQKEC